MRRVEASFANDPFTSTDGVPHLHPDAIGRLRKAISMGKNSAQVELRKTEVIGAREMLSSQGQVRSSTDQHRQDRISDLGCWPALGEVAAAKLTKSDLKRR